jgi:hypothetical protein
MYLSILISLDPRGPEVTVYINRNGWGFSEELSFPIKKRVRLRLGPKKLPHNASINLARNFFRDILKDACKLDGKEWNVTNDSYVTRVTGQGKSVCLDVDSIKSEQVLTFIKKFIKMHNLSENGNQPKPIELTFSKRIPEFSFAAAG